MASPWTSAVPAAGLEVVAGGSRPRLLGEPDHSADLRQETCGSSATSSVTGLIINTDDQGL